jgi:type IX secretion system PorP/SprF family membrane protein
MKKALVILLVCLSAGIEAQQLPQYTHFVTNYFHYNPAMAGSAPCLDLKLGYRKQWGSFPGAPTTAFANAHGNFGGNGKNFHGVGGLVETDDTGILAFTSIYLAYAYHMKATRRSMISAGVAVGVHQYRIDYGRMELADFADPLAVPQGSNFLFPQVNAGLWWYREDRFIGFSIRNLVGKDIAQLDQGKLRPHYELMMGKNVELNDEFKFKPAAQLKYVAKSKVAIDVQGMMAYKDKIQLGLGFRSGNGLAGLIQVDMFKYLTLAYAYDLTLSKMRNGGTSSHELILGLQACPDGEQRGIPCAAYD